MTTGRHRATLTRGWHRAALTTGWRRYLADRGVASTLAAVLAVAVAVTALVTLLNTRKKLDEWWVPLASIGPLLAVVFMVRTLAGDNVRLEQSTPRLRPRWRLAHAITAVVLSAAIMSIAACSELKDSEASELIRNVFGFSGLVLLTTPLLNIASAWAPTAGYTLFTLLTISRESGTLTAMWAWHMQPSARNSSWVAAAALLTVGIAAYVRRGPSPERS